MKIHGVVGIAPFSNLDMNTQLHSLTAIPPGKQFPLGIVYEAGWTSASL
jgi:hypothetical protein